MVKFSREAIIEAHSCVSKIIGAQTPFVYYIDIGSLRWLAWDGALYVATDELMATNQMLEHGETYNNFFVVAMPPLAYAGAECSNCQLATDEALKSGTRLLDGRRKASPSYIAYDREYAVVYAEVLRRLNARERGYKPKTVGSLPRDTKPKKSKKSATPKKTPDDTEK